MAEIKTEQIGASTETYILPCGCKVFVKFPGEWIHFHYGQGKCPELIRLWSNYWESSRIESWESHTRYIECLWHVGASRQKIAAIEKRRSFYPHPENSAQCAITE